MQQRWFDVKYIDVRWILWLELFKTLRSKFVEALCVNEHESKIKLTLPTRTIRLEHKMFSVLIIVYFF